MVPLRRCLQPDPGDPLQPGRPSRNSPRFGYPGTVRPWIDPRLRRILAACSTVSVSPISCVSAEASCTPLISACLQGPDAGRRVCDARKWPSARTCRATTTHGWNKVVDRARHGRSSLHSSLRCAATPTKQITCSTWRGSNRRHGQSVSTSVLNCWLSSIDSRTSRCGSPTTSTMSSGRTPSPTPSRPALVHPARRPSPGSRGRLAAALGRVRRPPSSNCRASCRPPRCDDARC